MNLPAADPDLRMALRLMVIADSRLARGRTHVEIVRQALRGGATAIQLRDKESEDRDVLIRAREVAALCERARALFFVNDRVDVARLAGGGCHLGPDDLDIRSARRLLSPPALLGFSAGTPAEAVAAAEAGADYLGVGPVFVTSTKEDAGEPLTVDGLAGIVAATSLPVVAIGGIHTGNAADCIEAGACGVAVIRAVVAAATVAPAARALRRTVDRALEARA
jgi:thiamine-phosphate diphosphorylase